MIVSEFILPSCLSCFDLSSNCEHRQRYDKLVKLIEGHQIHAMDPVSVSDCRTWMGGRCEDNLIGIWMDAVPIYGWDMMASILIHEFGHILCYRTERIPQEPTVEIEMKANQYGFDSAKVRKLVPELYWYYREFFMSNYWQGGESEQSCLQRLQEWSRQHS